MHQKWLDHGCHLNVTLGENLEIQNTLSSKRIKRYIFKTPFSAEDVNLKVLARFDFKFDDLTCKPEIRACSVSIKENEFYFPESWRIWYCKAL